MLNIMVISTIGFDILRLVAVATVRVAIMRVTGVTAVRVTLIAAMITKDFDSFAVTNMVRPGLITPSHDGGGETSRCN